ncbi:ABC-2 transporter permease [Paenibacillus donghaensis]|uniref:ABC-2 transporter permease n=1 Tax=Paenibacillus donghaensis TaxID=414771 RepID=A0A2Z2K693_9BACL|nr:ABC-2 transporter permease [Paenibacillus donghaensis]ASA21696.1 hypothetical protein B9T62_13520 [Paenibacillus donghaensis]
MSNVVRLIRKDCYLVRYFSCFAVAYNLFILYNLPESSGLDVMITCLLLLMFGCSIEVRQNNWQYVMSLPVTRTEIVRAKYLSLIPYLLFALLCSFVLSSVAGLLGIMEKSGYGNALILSIVLIPIGAALYLPVYFGMEYRKVMNTLFNVSTSLLIISAAKLDVDVLIAQELGYTGLPDTLLLAGAGVCDLLLLYASYRLSLVLFRS